VPRRRRRAVRRRPRRRDAARIERRGEHALDDEARLLDIGHDDADSRRAVRAGGFEPLARPAGGQRDFVARRRGGHAQRFRRVPRRAAGEHLDARALEGAGELTHLGREEIESVEDERGGQPRSASANPRRKDIGKARGLDEPPLAREAFVAGRPVAKCLRVLVRVRALRDRGETPAMHEAPGFAAGGGRRGGRK